MPLCALWDGTRWDSQRSTRDEVNSDAEIADDESGKPGCWEFVASLEFHNACVARPITKKELAYLEKHDAEEHEKAIDAMKKE